MKKINKILLVILLLTFTKVCILHAALIPMDSQTSAILSYDDANNIMHFPVNLDIRGSSDANKIIKYNAAGGINIFSGTITGITDLAIADGGTGASTAAGAVTNLGFTETAANISTVATGKYGTKGMILGDTTAGRVLRRTEIDISAYDPNTLSVEVIGGNAATGFNGDTAAQHNVAKDHTETNYALSSTGETLGILDAAITGTLIAVLTGELLTHQDGSLTISHAYVFKSGTGIGVKLYNQNTAIDLCSISGTAKIGVLYLTSE